MCRDAGAQGGVWLKGSVGLTGFMVQDISKLTSVDPNAIEGVWWAEKLGASTVRPGAHEFAW